MKLPLSWIREFVDVPLDISLDSLESAFVKVGSLRGKLTAQLVMA